jgi:N-acetylglucosamine-6-phosphate deacetylase
MRIVARNFRDACWLEVSVRDGLIARVRSTHETGTLDPEDDWIAPAFWDIQVNGRWGHSFTSPDLTVEQVAEIVRAQGPLGTAKLCPTLITASVDDLFHGVRTIAAACEAFPDVGARVVGIHLEGPFISEREGYRGAHSAGSIRDPDWSLFQELQEASGGRIVLTTLAPERIGAIHFIRRATAAGVVIGLGHTAAGAETIRAATEAGARLSTHLGNGIASELSRHPNPIWLQAASPVLVASLIADGHHLDLATLRVLARAKGIGHTILISDASPLAGLPPGIYGDWTVDPAGKIVVTGTPYLAGSNQGIEVGLQNLLAASGWTLAQAIRTVTATPARLLGKPVPRIAPGQPGNLVVFRCPQPDTFVLKRVCVMGQWELG